jgi:hypothetical protein
VAKKKKVITGTKKTTAELLGLESFASWSARQPLSEDDARNLQKMHEGGGLSAATRERLAAIHGKYAGNTKQDDGPTTAAPPPIRKIGALVAPGWAANPVMVCPHCQTRGFVRTKYSSVKVGVSGGKATAALLTAGLSLFVTGLSRKTLVTEAHCGQLRLRLALLSARG